jgi:hypothetical protein
MPRDTYTPTGQLAGDLIREEMNRRGWKQAKLEERTSLSRAGLYRALKGATTWAGWCCGRSNGSLNCPPTCSRGCGRGMWSG